uniref:ribosomal protein S3 n=1 Tax=Dapsilanthus disjunctus TaxID=2919630 RepID=UPI001F128E75|nr:ribosomal protein S3 [Dapsilanthus disjunctus]ULQ65113.1 ribosomal protein S3 [Dapsilanthus disjunctus]ULQ65201.1 ribosomal protein S3 [Dapsilanthus disjunctus]
MGRKINPIGFRLGTNQNHYSFWFAEPKDYSAGLQEDEKIRSCVKNYVQNYVQQKKRLQKNRGMFSHFKGIVCIEIKKEIDLTRVIIYIAIPDFLKKEEEQKEGQRKGQKEGQKKGKKEKKEEKKEEEWYSWPGIKALEMNLKKEFHSVNQRLKMTIKKVKEPYKQPSILAEYIALQIRNRVPFRKAMKEAEEFTKKTSIKGFHVQIAGRIGGSEVARTRSVKWGRLPLQTIRAKIDHCAYPIRTIHGVLGIKIWMFID